VSVFDGLIFDCDGVLIDSEAIGIRVERELLASWGLNYELETFLSRFVGLHNRDFYAALRSDADANGRPLPEDFPDVMQAAIWGRFETDLVAIAGAADAAKAFRGPTAVASSSEADKLGLKLMMSGLHPIFDPHIYSADAVTNGKPAPDLFLHAAGVLGVDPSRCLVIEDSINGVRSGLAAGMTVWGFTGGGHADAGLTGRLSAAGAHKVFSSHHDIAQAFAAG
jgi:beta-phosphoglucomutase-like phosphatase (HAD superfamily)